MNRIFRNFLILSVAALSFAACRKKAFDEYYGRPATLANPIYQRLGELGNFKSLLAVIDRSGYKDILSAAGYWTMFAPNDSAFVVFLKARNLTTADQLDSGTCAQIVTYSLVYNAYLKARLGDYQAPSGWVPNQAFKRKTPNYVGFYTDTTGGTSRLTLSSNISGGYTAGDNNNKSIPYFVDNFMTNKQLTSYDYNYFFPNTTYTGFNVIDARVTQQDIVAENGYINVIDKVLLPLANIDQYLASNPQYSLFKKLYDRYMVSYIQNATATTKYFNITGNPTNVYIKTYNSGLTFSPNVENFLTVGGNDAQQDGWSIFVPTNDVLTTYINTVILEKYASLDQIPIQIIIDLLNAHMWGTTVWPSRFAKTTNIQGEPARFDPAVNVIDKQVLSNGMFYGTNIVQQADVFRSVYGKVYLDPAYSLMKIALDNDAGLGLVIKNPAQKYTVMMMSDKLLRSQGYDYNVNYAYFTYTAPGTVTVAAPANANSTVFRILETSVAITPKDEMSNYATGSGIIETYGGEYIKYNAGQLTSSANVDKGTTVPTSGGTKLAFNGRIIYIDSLLNFSTNTVGFHLKALAGTSAANSDYFTFYQYLAASPLFNTATGDITGVQPGVFYTLFVPNNAAMTAAINAKMIAATPALAIATQGARDSLNNFIYYHFLNKNTVVPDGKKTGSYASLLKNSSGDPSIINIASTPGTMTLTDNNQRTANVVVAKSNNLSTRCVIHLIDNYLKY